MNIVVPENPSFRRDWEKRNQGPGPVIGWDEWNDLFHVFLGAPEPGNFAEGDSFYDYELRKKTQFTQYVTEKGFPLQARFNDIYDDFTFQPDEVVKLRHECTTLRERMGEARPGANLLRNLTAACDSALAVGSSIVLSAD